MSRDSVNFKDRTRRFGEFNVSALLSDDNGEPLRYAMTFRVGKKIVLKYYQNNTVLLKYH